MPCGARDVARVRGEAGILVVGFDKVSAFEPVNSFDCLRKGVDYNVGPDPSRDFVVTVKTGAEPAVLGCGKCGLACPSEAYDRGCSAPQTLQQGFHAEVVGVVRPDRPAVIDAKIRGSDSFAFGTVPVGRVERVALERCGDVYRLVSVHEALPCLLEVGSLYEFVCISASVCRGEQSRAQ